MGYSSPYTVRDNFSSVSTRQRNIKDTKITDEMPVCITFSYGRNIALFLLQNSSKAQLIYVKPHTYLAHKGTVQRGKIFLPQRSFL